MCGTYIEESKKFLLDNYKAIAASTAAACAVVAIPVIGAVACAGAQIALAVAKSNIEKEAAVRDGINKFFESKWADITASVHDVGPYRCEQVGLLGLVP